MLQRTVILLSTQRTGSHYLKDQLGAHAGILCSMEILWKPEALRIDEAGPFGEMTMQDRPFWEWYVNQLHHDPEQAQPDRRIPLFFEYLQLLENRFPGQTLVHDIKYNTIRSLGGFVDDDGVSGLFVRQILRNVRAVLHLRRRNTLRIHASRLLARQSQLWHDFGTQRAGAPGTKPHKQIEMPIPPLVETLSTIEQSATDYADALRGLPTPDFTIWYEDITFPGIETPEKRRTSEDALRDAIGQPIRIGGEGKAAYRKVNPQPLPTLISNWVEVADALRDTSFAWMLEEDNGIAPSNPPDPLGVNP